MAFSSFQHFNRIQLVTIALPYIPTIPTITNITSTGATISTVTNSQGSVTYKLLGTNLAIAPVLSTSTTTSITGLTTETLYTVYVVATNSSGSKSSSTVTFTTLPVSWVAPVLTSSSNYGNNWLNTTIPILSSSFYSGCQISYTGQYMAVSYYKGGMYISNDFGSTWTFVTISISTRNVIMSSSGRYMFTNSGSNYDSYYSSNYGVSFVAIGTANTIFQSEAYYCFSRNEKNMAYINNGILNTSSDFGKTFTIPSYFSSKNVSSVTMSFDGTVQIVVEYGQYINIHVSRDSGSSWVVSFLVAVNTTKVDSIRISDDGKYVMVLIDRTYSIGIYGPRAPNYQWTTTTVNATTSTINAGTSRMSSSGQYQIICAGSYLLISSDYGASFTSQQNIDGNYLQYSSMSESGKYIMCCTTSDRVYESSDYGVSFNFRLNSSGNNGLSLSGNAQYQIACGYQIVSLSSN